MDSCSSDEENSKIESWVSIRFLKEAANIQSVYRQRSRSSSIDSTSPIPSEEPSITVEWKPNGFVNQSICFNAVNRNKTIDTPKPTEASPDFEELQCLLQHKDAKIQKIRQKSQCLLEKSNKDLIEAKLHYKQANQEIATLKKMNELIKEQNSKQLEDLQVRHERKLQKVKQDVDNYLSELYEKAAVYVTEKLKISHKREIMGLKEQYEEKINRMRMEYEAEIDQKDYECRQLLEQLEEQTEEFTEENSEKYINLIKNHVQNEREKKKKGKDGKVDAMMRQVEEQKLIIESQQRIIDDLSRELQDSFRRRSRISGMSNKTCHVKSQKSFQGLLDQLSCFLDTADPNTSRELEDTLRGFQSRHGSSEKLSF
ncbi:unnamed protein product [Blepharisma stoltei]|uniref:Uncharacterized protein n=1 Tax=Blepharisma stoltei TaxID=1481888 RepID=A0AAU9JIR1_9CILI|nr:unnamed protein product [Blepharisma stoltei]